MACCQTASFLHARWSWKCSAEVTGDKTEAHTVIPVRDCVKIRASSSRRADTFREQPTQLQPSLPAANDACQCLGLPRTCTDFSQRPTKWPGPASPATVQQSHIIKAPAPRSPRETGRVRLSSVPLGRSQRGIVPCNLGEQCNARKAGRAWQLRQVSVQLGLRSCDCRIHLHQAHGMVTITGDSESLHPQVGVSATRKITRCMYHLSSNDCQRPKLESLSKLLLSTLPSTPPQPA